MQGPARSLRARKQLLYLANPHPLDHQLKSVHLLQGEAEAWPDAVAEGLQLLLRWDVHARSDFFCAALDALMHRRDVLLLGRTL